MGAFDHLEWTYDGAFEQLFGGLGRGEFEQKFSKNSNVRGVARGGGMLKLRFDWYISFSPSSANKLSEHIPAKVKVYRFSFCPTASHNASYNELSG